RSRGDQRHDRLSVGGAGDQRPTVRGDQRHGRLSVGGAGDQRPTVRGDRRHGRLSVGGAGDQRPTVRGDRRHGVSALAMVLGLTVAAVYGTSDFAGGLATKRVSALWVLGISQAVGLVVALLAAGLDSGADPSTAALVRGAIG